YVHALHEKGGELRAERLHLAVVEADNLLAHQRSGGAGDGAGFAAKAEVGNALAGVQVQLYAQAVAAERAVADRRVRGIRQVAKTERVAVVVEYDGVVGGHGAILLANAEASCPALVL